MIVNNIIYVRVLISIDYKRSWPLSNRIRSLKNADEDLNE